MREKLAPAIGVTATAILVVLHVLTFLHGGALWRDEANSASISSMPARELWENLQRDSFPVLWFALLRVWTASGLGASDAGLRALGLILGLGIVAVLWRNARAFGVRSPLVSLALLGFNAAVVTFGDSIRGYGLGMLTGLLAFGLVWEFADDPTSGKLALLSVAALVSVHCLFYNAVFLLAASAGGAAVAVWRRQARTVLCIGMVGLACAGSMLVYGGTIERQREWNILVRTPIDLPWIWRQFSAAVSLTARPFPWLWLALGVLAVAAAPLLLRGASTLTRRQKDVVLFSAVALLTGTIAYVAFLLRLSYPMQPWYFLAFMAMGAASFEGILSTASGSGALRLVRMVLAVAVMALALPGVWRVAHVRRTNLDLVAAKVASMATKDDLVVVSPWYCGVTFDRYYRGSAEWETVPPLPVHRIHRYDLMKRAMMSPDAMGPLLERMQSVLEGGHRIFWVGEILAPPPGQPPPVLPPAPQTPWGWQETPYIRSWILQAGAVLRRDALRAATVPVPVESPVNGYENLPVIIIERGARS